MDCMLYQILFRGSVTNLLRLVLLREYNLCEAYIRLFLPKQKKEKVQSVQGEEYEKGEKQKEGGGNLKIAFLVRNTTPWLVSSIPTSHPTANSKALGGLPVPSPSPPAY